MKAFNIHTKVIFLLCLLLGLIQSPQAAGNLFYAEVEITDESAKARQISIANAFHKVLIKLTGNSKIKAHEGVSGLLKKSPDYVSQYRYRVAEVSNDIQQDDEPVQATKYIQIQFDKNSVERALAAAGIATWEGSRPEVMLWLAYERHGKGSLLDGETLPQAIPVLQQAAEDRGLPLQLPLMDLQDQAALSAADIWTGNERAIKQASRRYPHDVILTAIITGTEGGEWNGNWILYSRDEPSEFTCKGEALQHALNCGMNHAADLLARIYAPLATGVATEYVGVRILQVDSAGDYARVMSLINQQNGVSRVSVKQVRADELILDVWVSGGVESLGNSLPLSGELIPVTDVQEAGEAQVHELSFRLSH